MVYNLRLHIFIQKSSLDSMRLLYFLIILFSLNSEVYSQKLFKSFVFQMPMEEARLILSKDSKILKNLFVEIFLVEKEASFIKLTPINMTKIAP